jgi:hypothetical protein
MKKKLWLFALVVAVVISGHAAWADGDFYVIAGGGGAVGTKISSVPYTITQPGFYYLGGNLTMSAPGAAITVKSSHVTIDLMGFTLSGPAGTGIYLPEGSNVVEIRNGVVTGFENGVYADSINSTSHRVINLRTTLCTDAGISLSGKNHLITGCTSTYNNLGIWVTEHCLIINNVASYNGYGGIGMTGTGSIIGNIAVYTGTIGFAFGGSPIVIDRNSASDNPTNYSPGSSLTAWGVNAGRIP